MEKQWLLSQRERYVESSMLRQTGICNNYRTTENAMNRKERCWVSVVFTLVVNPLQMGDTRAKVGNSKTIASVGQPSTSCKTLLTTFWVQKEVLEICHTRSMWEERKVHCSHCNEQFGHSIGSWSEVEAKEVKMLIQEQHVGEFLGIQEQHVGGFLGIQEQHVRGFLGIQELKTWTVFRNYTSRLFWIWSQKRYSGYSYHYSIRLESPLSRDWFFTYCESVFW